MDAYNKDKLFSNTEDDLTGLILGAIAISIRRGY
jgi:hypothetical protein